MATNPEEIFKSLESCTDKLYAAMDELSSISTAAVSIGGVIGQTLPTQANSLMDKIQEIISDPQTSLTSMQDFMSNVPLGQMRPLTAQERANQIEAKPKPQFQPSTDLTASPAAPKSAIAAAENAQNDQYREDAENENLKEWYSDRYGKTKRKSESYNPYSWDAIKNDTDITDYDIGDVGDDNVLYDDPDIDIDLPDDSEFEEEYNAQDADPSDFGTYEYSDLTDDDDNFSIGGRRVAESQETPTTWQSIAANSGIKFDMKATTGPAVSGLGALREVDRT